MIGSHKDEAICFLFHTKQDLEIQTSKNANWFVSTQWKQSVRTQKMSGKRVYRLVNADCYLADSVLNKLLKSSRLPHTKRKRKIHAHLFF